MGTIYLLHFDRPISDHHTTQHYLGYTDNLTKRIAAHRRGEGARLCAVAKERSITFTVARTWKGTRSEERRIKQCKNHPRLCPLCSPR